MPNIYRILHRDGIVERVLQVPASSVTHTSASVEECADEAAVADKIAELELAQTPHEKLTKLFDSVPAEARAALEVLRVPVRRLLEDENYAAAAMVIDAVTVPEGLEASKARMLAILAEAQ